MRQLEDKGAITMAINRHDLPVVRVDLADINDYGLVGGRVLIDAGTFRDGFPYLIKGRLMAYRDERRWTVSTEPVGITNDFTYYDMEDLLAWANVPIIKPDSEVIICVVDSESRAVFKPVVLKTGKVTRHCSTPIRFQDADASMYMALAVKGVKNRERRANVV